MQANISEFRSPVEARFPRLEIDGMRCRSECRTCPGEETGGGREFKVTFEFRKNRI
jgi:hypothetical protein